MPVIAIINVYKCDGENCNAIASVDVLKELEQHEFENSWSIGLVYDFCPACKDSKKAEKCSEIEMVFSDLSEIDPAKEIEKLLSTEVENGKLN